MHFKFLKNSKGFTLLEILLVVGIISLLAGIVIIAINPSKQLATVRNAQRKSDVKQLNSAITQYYIANGRYPTSLPTTLKEVCATGSLSTTTGSDITCGSNLVDLTVLVPTYITSIPLDPQASTTNGIGYYVKKEPANSKLIVISEQAELGSIIAIGTTTSPFATGGGESELETGCTATGGEETTVGGYKIHTFTDVGSDTFTVTSDSCDVEVLVVAGGGGGGGNLGGGGGGGGVKTANISVSGTNEVVVGDKGLGSTAYSNNPSNGEDSSFNSIEALGGGAGGSGWFPTEVMVGMSGGSGGGGWGGEYSWPSTGGSGDSEQGNDGGTGDGLRGAGGGGGGEIGEDASVGAGNGGEGTSNNFSGSSHIYGSGGGGGSGNGEGDETYGLGGTGAGNGGVDDGVNTTRNAGDATYYGCGGGGAGWTNANGDISSGDGYKGIVIVRYAI